MRQSPVTSKQVQVRSLKSASPVLWKCAPTSSSHCSAQSAHLGTEGERCQVPTKGTGEQRRAEEGFPSSPWIQFQAGQVKVRTLGEEDLGKTGNAEVASFTNRF